jgi:hypothetical protein
MSDSCYVVPGDIWPVGTDDDRLSPEQIYAVLDRFDEFYLAALEGLAATETLPADEESS